jgi:hypothetical protein
MRIWGICLPKPSAKGACRPVRSGAPTTTTASFFKTARVKFLADCRRDASPVPGLHRRRPIGLHLEHGPRHGPIRRCHDRSDRFWSITEVGGSKELADPWYFVQILPFDVTIAGANEYGAMAAAKIFGAEILQEGWGSLIEDAVSDIAGDLRSPRG